MQKYRNINRPKELTWLALIFAIISLNQREIENVLGGGTGIGEIRATRQLMV